MPSESGGDITGLLAQWAGGNRGALDALTPLVYGELRKIADAYLRRERPEHTLQPTALVHEAWVRLANADHPPLAHRKHFYALAARIMRRILVDHARAQRAAKRDGHAVMAAQHQPPLADQTIELLALDEALEQLARVSARQARIIELRYFGGLGIEETADILDLSIATVSRDQKTAESWLGLVIRAGAE